MPRIEYAPISLGMNGKFGLHAGLVAADPWPKFAIIQDYDAWISKDRNGKRVIKFSLENGSATYGVVRRDRFGAYLCKLRRSTYSPQRSAG